MKKENWISVNDKLPDNSDPVVVHCPALKILGPVLIGAYYDDTETWAAWEFRDTISDATVTHWQPIVLPY